MRRHEREITDKRELEAVLAKATVVHLAMTDGARPYVVPMNFGFAGGCLYVHCAKEGRKVDILRRNPHVCFNVFTDDAVIPGHGPTACSFTSRYRSVTGSGRVEFIDDDEGRRKALDVILAHYAAGPFQYDDAALARTCVLRIDVESMTGKKANL